jgi:hypothetical protein
MFEHTKDLPESFERAVLDLCAELGTPELPCKWRDLLGCWMSESDVRATALNHGGWASGLFQLMPDTARGLGWRHGDKRWEVADAARASGNWQALSRTHESLMREYTALSPLEQLRYARKFYLPSRGLLTSAAACYVKTFLPAELPHASNPGHVLCAQAGAHPDYPRGKYTGAYSANHYAFDKVPKRGWIEVRDLSRRIAEVCTGPRWEELVKRMEAAEGGGAVGPFSWAGSAARGDGDG